MKSVLVQLITLKTLFLVFSMFTNFGFLQAQIFTRQDTLRGSITPQRAWWDLQFYDLSVNVSLKDSSISGKNTIVYKVEKAQKLMQIDLQSPMKITKVIQDGKQLAVASEGNAHFIRLKKKQVQGSVQSVTVFFEGKPAVSVNPPWSGGFTWEKDEHGKDFVATSCQGIGASLWWPCKDHPADEPDSMQISVGIPAESGLTAVSNGRLERSVANADGTRTFAWKVRNPINNYAVNINIGNYERLSEVYAGARGALQCDYYVLKHHVKPAKEQFRQVPKMLEAFEYWFGPYPFYEDSYKLVEVPYLGMEHQSSVTYGNNFRNGYNRNGEQVDLSGTGWGFNFDFIIIHESGHEWFANSITDRDVADMWIHEGFTSYAENLYLDYFYGKEAGADYVIGTRGNIRNDRPLIGSYDVNYEGSGDMYYKGANMLHTLRHLVDNDEQWRNILRKMNAEFYHRTVSSQQVEDFLSRETGMKLKPFFDQYLRDTKIPKLEYRIEGRLLKYRWTNCVPDFDMKLKVTCGKTLWLHPSAEWKEMPVSEEKLEIDRHFYIESKSLK